MDASLFYRHLFTVPERTIKAGRKFSLWRTCNALLWKGKIVQDTPDEIAKALTNQSEVSHGVISNSYMHVMYIAIVNLEISLLQQW